MSWKNNQRGGAARLAFCILVFLPLTACVAVAPALTPTATPSPQPLATITPTPWPTATWVVAASATQPAASATQPAASATQPAASETQPAATETPPATAGVAKCALPTVVAPPTPAATVAFGTLDRATGLHVTGRPQTIDLTTYRLVVSGLVDHPLKLTYDDLRCLPKAQAQAILICVGAFEDEATWSGPTLAAVLDLAGVQTGAKEIKLVSADEYTVAMPLDAARETQNLLAYELNGQTLPVLHGFPVRAVFPDLSGNKWLKWLVEIEVY